MQAGTHVPRTRFCTSAAIRGSISLAITRLHAGRMRTVRLPVPGPTSRTTSVGLSSALSTILGSAHIKHIAATPIHASSLVRPALGLGHSPLRDQRVGQDMLSEPVRVEEMVPRGAARGPSSRGRALAALLLRPARSRNEPVLPCKRLRGSLGHWCWCGVYLPQCYGMLINRATSQGQLFDHVQIM